MIDAMKKALEALEWRFSNAAEAIEALRQAIEQAEKQERVPESWMGITDNPYCNDANCNDPNGRAMRWHNKLLDLRKKAALDGLEETSREIEQEPVAWVRDLTSPQPHCVTSMKYLSIADTDAGVKYIPVYTVPPSKPWVGLDDIDFQYQPPAEVITMKYAEAILKEKNT
jgi:hypothetical protein